MGKKQLVQRPASPAPPINARITPAAQSAGNEPQEEIMVDITSETFEESVKPDDEPREEPVRILDEPGEEPVRIYDGRGADDEEVKVYVPQKKEQSGEIFSDSSHSAPAPVYEEEEPEQYDGNEIAQDNHLGVWITVIIALSVMCVGAAGLYAFVNGYFDNLIAALF